MPTVTAEAGDGFVRLSWDDVAERGADPVTGEFDFEGYRIYVSEQREEDGFRLIRQIDLLGFAVAGLIINTALRPDPLQVAGGIDPDAPRYNPVQGATSALRVVWPNLQARLAIVAMAVSQMAMVAVMTMTPRPRARARAWWPSSAWKTPWPTPRRCWPRPARGP